MPLFKKKTHIPQPPPADLSETEEVFLVRHTGEVFRSYEDYLQAIQLYRQKVWTCKYTLKTGLTYEEALASEEESSRIAQQFPEPFKAFALRLVHTSPLPQEELVTKIFDAVKEVFVVGEDVTVAKDKSGKRGAARITKAPAFVNSASGKEEVEDGNGDGSHALYEVEWLDGASSETLLASVNKADIRRKKHPLPRVVIRSWLLQVASKAPGKEKTWQVHADTLQQFDLSNKAAAVLQEAEDAAESARKKRKEAKAKSAAKFAAKLKGLAETTEALQDSQGGKQEGEMEETTEVQVPAQISGLTPGKGSRTKKPKFAEPEPSSAASKGTKASVQKAPKEKGPGSSPAGKTPAKAKVKGKASTPGSAAKSAGKATSAEKKGKTKQTKQGAGQGEAGEEEGEMGEAEAAGKKHNKKRSKPDAGLSESLPDHIDAAVPKKKAKRDAEDGEMKETGSKGKMEGAMEGEAEVPHAEHEQNGHQDSVMSWGSGKTKGLRTKVEREASSPAKGAWPVAVDPHATQADHTPVMTGDGEIANKDRCSKCKRIEDLKGSDMLLCDSCPRSYHLQCLDPPLNAEDVPEHAWHCPKCAEAEEARLKKLADIEERQRRKEEKDRAVQEEKEEKERKRLEEKEERERKRQEEKEEREREKEMEKERRRARLQLEEKKRQYPMEDLELEQVEAEEAALARSAGLEPLPTQAERPTPSPPAEALASEFAWAEQITPELFGDLLEVFEFLQSVGKKLSVPQLSLVQLMEAVAVPEGEPKQTLVQLIIGLLQAVIEAGIADSPGGRPGVGVSEQTLERWSRLIDGTTWQEVARRYLVHGSSPPPEVRASVTELGSKPATNLSTRTILSLLRCLCNDNLAAEETRALLDANVEQALELQRTRFHEELEARKEKNLEIKKQRAIRREERLAKLQAMEAKAGGTAGEGGAEKGLKRNGAEGGEEEEEEDEEEEAKAKEEEEPSFDLPLELKEFHGDPNDRRAVLAHRDMVRKEEDKLERMRTDYFKRRDAERRAAERQRAEAQRKKLEELRKEEEAQRKREEAFEKEMAKLVIRTAPLGKDRHHNRVWWFPSEKKTVFIESCTISPETGDMSETWGCYSTKEEVDRFLESLNVKGVREAALHAALSKVYGKLIYGLVRKKGPDKQLKPPPPRTRTTRAGEAQIDPDLTATIEQSLTPGPPPSQISVSKETKKVGPSGREDKIRPEDPAIVSAFTGKVISLVDRLDSFGKKPDGGGSWSSWKRQLRGGGEDVKAGGSQLLVLEALAYELGAPVTKASPMEKGSRPDEEGGGEGQGEGEEGEEGKGQEQIEDGEGGGEGEAVDEERVPTVSQLEEAEEEDGMEAETEGVKLWRTWEIREAWRGEVVSAGTMAQLVYAVATLSEHCEPLFEAWEAQMQEEEEEEEDEAAEDLKASTKRAAKPAVLKSYQRKRKSRTAGDDSLGQASQDAQYVVRRAAEVANAEMAAAAKREAAWVDFTEEGEGLEEGQEEDREEAEEDADYVAGSKGRAGSGSAARRKRPKTFSLSELALKGPEVPEAPVTPHPPPSPPPEPICNVCDKSGDGPVGDTLLLCGTEGCGTALHPSCGEVTRVTRRWNCQECTVKTKLTPRSSSGKGQTGKGQMGGGQSEGGRGVSSHGKEPIGGSKGAGKGEPGGGPTGAGTAGSGHGKEASRAAAEEDDQQAGAASPQDQKNVGATPQAGAGKAGKGAKKGKGKTGKHGKKAHGGLQQAENQSQQPVAEDPDLGLANGGEAEEEKAPQADPSSQEAIQVQALPVGAVEDLAQPDAGVARPRRGSASKGRAMEPEGKSKAEAGPEAELNGSMQGHTAVENGVNAGGGGEGKPTEGGTGMDQSNQAKLGTEATGSAGGQGNTGVVQYNRKMGRKSTPS